MTWLFNNPSNFYSEMLSGFVSAHKGFVRQVPGGVIRATESQKGTVAIVIGGGSGHYPAFAGYVGQGLAHGAAMGNLFASPSAKQICSVARAANNGAGVLFAFGNYAGDLLHFGLAMEQLNAEGIPCEMIAITDDISSASKNEIEKRRGVAGNLATFKITAAAAESGLPLKDVLAIAKKTNDRTRTIGVAFSGCKLPGAEEPLFVIPDGMMGLGMGIHGEPGISQVKIPDAKQLAGMLVEQLMNDLPSHINSMTGIKEERVGVILNGLGSVKYEELFVLWNEIDKCLIAQGMTIADIQIGEFVTSFDMAGLSLSFVWFDTELEKFWLEPASSPAFKRGTVSSTPLLKGDNLAEAHQEIIPEASTESRETAELVVSIISDFSDIIIKNAEKLGNIDAVAGDGDHGIGMERGVRAAKESAQSSLANKAGAGTVLRHAADAWADKAGGTSGAIWGVILNTIGVEIGDKHRPDAQTVAKAITQAAHNVMSFGKAKVGDKTLVDVLFPFSERLQEEVDKGLPFTQAWRNATDFAEKCANETANLLPKMGRARPHAERSLGTPDAGAISLAMIVSATGQCLSTRKNIE